MGLAIVAPNSSIADALNKRLLMIGMSKGNAKLVQMFILALEDCFKTDVE